MICLASPFAAACGKSACEKAVERDIECAEDPDQKKNMKEAKSLMVGLCEADKSAETKAELECYKKTKGCEELEACQEGMYAAESAKRTTERVTESIGKGDYDGAISSCSYDVENYKASPEFKAACDKAITEGFSKLEDPTWKCRGESEFLTASEPLRAECTKLADTLKKKIETARDAGADDDYSTCSSYKDVVTAVAPDKTKAAEILCKEMSATNYAKKALDEIKANIAKKEVDIPFQCTSFLDTEGMDGSAWFKTKSAEVAKACFGEMGKLALAEVDSYCTYGGKQVHEYAPKYDLAKADPDLAKALEKTAKVCKE